MSDLGTVSRKKVAVLLDFVKITSTVVTVADVSDEDRGGNNLLHTWELRLGNKAKLLFRL